MERDAGVNESNAPSASESGEEPKLSFDPKDLPVPSGFPDDPPSSIRRLSSRPPPSLEARDDSDSPPSARHDGDAHEGDKPSEGYQHRSTVAAKAFRGLFWMATTGIGSRIVSLISTLLLTRYVLPEDYGDVQNTFIVCWMVDLITQLGLPQYVATRADISAKHIYHATIYFHLAGTLGMALIWLFASEIGPHFGAPHMAAFMPGFFVAIQLTRLATMPDRILVRQLRFRASSALRAGSEVVYALVSLGLAASSKRFDFTIAGHAILFGSGFAIVWGNIARGLFRLSGTLVVTRIKDWFAIVRLEKKISRELLGFGVPLTIAGLGSIGARRWDNLVIGNLFGAATSGIYNFAYNLADVPPSVVGESLGDVLAPAFANTAPADRARELVRWVAVSGLVCFPLGVGLSAVAPSLSWLFNEKWHAAVPMIVLLGSLSLTRPIIGTVFAYLQAQGKGRTLMVLEWAKAAGIVAVMWVAGRALRITVSEETNNYWGPLVACASVGVVMFASTLTYQVAGAKAGEIPTGHLVFPLVRPLLACVPMVLAVLGVRFLFGAVESKLWLVLRLTCEIVAGAIVFIPSAFVIAPKETRSLIDLLKTAIAKRRGGSS